MVVLQQNDVVDACLACGHKADALGPDGIYVTFSDRQADALIAFLQHEFDMLTCDACQASLNIAPTLVLAQTDPPAGFIVAGPRMVGREQQVIEALRAKANVECHVLRSLDDLRAHVESEIKRRLTRLQGVFEARIAGTLSEYIVDHWRELDGATFAALVVATTIQIPGVGFSMAWKSTEGTTPTPDDFLRSLGDAQASAWMALAMSWMKSTTHSGSLEDDLATYVDDAPVLPGSVERIQEYCTRLRAKSDKAGTRYVVSALQASICRAAGIENPDHATWATIFFAFENAALDQGDEFPEHWRAMLIAPGRAAATLPFQDAWNETARAVGEITATDPTERGRLFERIERLAAKAGYPTMASDVLDTTRLIVDQSTDAPYEVFEKVARRLAVTVSEAPAFFFGLRMSAKFLVERKRLTDLVRLADLAVELLGNTHENQARADVWLGRYFKEQRQPNLFFARAGEMAREWEHNLPLNLRASLWTERANALRLAGRQEDALAIHRQLDIDLAHDGDQDYRHTNRLNRGILERETGALDASVATLRSLLTELPATGEKRINALASLGVSLIVLRDFRSALPVYDEALALATGPYSERASELRANRGMAALALAREAEAATPSWEGLDPGTDGSTIVGVAGAWLLAVGRRKVEMSNERADGLVALLEQTSEQASERRDAGVAVNARLAASMLLDELDREDEAYPHWLALLRSCSDFDLPPQELALVRVARVCYLTGDPVRARIFLQQLPQSLAAAVGNVTDLAMAAESTATLSSALQDLADVVLFSRNAKAGWPDVRLAAELARDVVARARLQRRGGPDQAGPPVLEGGLDEKALGRLAQAAGTVCVLEWIESSQGVGGFVTRIDSDERVESTWIQIPEEIDLTDLAGQIRRRLDLWQLDDPADPFDLPAWRALEGELNQQLDPIAGPVSHLVVIEHEAYAGLPWHVALRRWSCSYSSGWDRLLREADGPARAAVARIGVALVPRARDSAAVVGALQGSLRRTEAMSAKTGIELIVHAGEACDRAAFVDMLEQVDAMKLLCHGFIGRDGSVSLMLAHDGQLPLANSVAAGSAIGAPNRVSWRDLQTLKSAPRVVFSAACSSGKSAIAGLGERLGLHSALAQAGTAAIVAPWWDIVAAEVIPILDDVCDAHLEGVPLGRAVHEASRRAAETRPTWLAWGLALEGDWR